MQWRLVPGFIVNTFAFTLFWPHTHKCNAKLQAATVPDSDPDFKTSIQVGKTKLFPCFVFAVFSSTVAPHSGDLQFSLMVPRLQELAGVESDNN